MKLINKKKKLYIYNYDSNKIHLLSSFDKIERRK